MTDIKFIGTNQVELVNSLNGNKISPVSSGENFIEFSFDSLSKNDQDYYHFAITGSNVEISGVIGEVTTKQQYTKLFAGCTEITKADQLTLTATDLTESCYAGMFLNCSNLKTPPTIAATGLAIWCYSGMFAGCSTLSTAPALPATTLAPYCYYAMFYGCSKLSASPYLPAETLTSWCYNSMFYNCSDLARISCNFSDWSGNATSSWVTNVAANGEFNNDNVEDIYSNSNIPSGWKTLEIKPLTFIAKNSSASIKVTKYNHPTNISLQYSKNGGEWINYSIGNTIDLNENEKVAFSGANNTLNDPLKYYYFEMTGNIIAKGNTFSLLNFRKDCSSGCFYRLFQDCESLLNSPLLPATTLADRCYLEMFVNCSNLSSASRLPVTILSNRCYQSMFDGCSNLSTAPALPATTLANNCYYRMFKDCGSLKTAPTLPATTLAPNCYLEMFGGCWRLTNILLPATELVSECYAYMFNGCSRLSSIEVAFTNWRDDIYATSEWVYGNEVGNGIFTKPSNLPATSGISYIPNNWTVINK